jgi:MGT family glycosyltransferase
MCGAAVPATLASMMRFLFATMPAAGHVGPLVPLAHELVARGHSIAWYTGDEYRGKVEATGATFYPHVHAPDRDVSRMDAEFPERAKLKGIAKFKFDVREVFIAAVPGQVADLEAMLDDVRPECVVAEPGMAAAARVIEQRHGIPWATCNISAFAMRSVDSAPFGLGLQPMDSRLGRLRNRLLNAAIYQTLYRSLDRDYHAMRAKLGMKGAAGGLFDETLSPYLYLQPTVPSFEYPRSDLAPQVHFVGPLLPPVPADYTVPAWWDEMLADPRPVVLVTQGTVATDPTDLVLPALDALRHEPVQVIAVTGGPDPADLPAPGANARIERFVPFAALMPHVAAVITNGGYGGLHFALAHGVPLVVAGDSEEKPELVARVNWSGVGVGMRTSRPTRLQLREAVRTLMAEPEHAARAAAMQAEMSSHGGADHAADLLERLAATGAPVPATAAPPGRHGEHDAVRTLF